MSWLMISDKMPDNLPQGAILLLGMLIGSNRFEMLSSVIYWPPIQQSRPCGKQKDFSPAPPVLLNFPLKFSVPALQPPPPAGMIPWY
jgi:hypothetical protein